MRRHLFFVGLCILGFLFCVMPVTADYTGPCPTGTNGAPALRNPGLSSGALCRGACGIDCPAHRCLPLADEVKVINKGTADQGICTYTHVVMCDSHQGCRDHDACYDVCTESHGETSLLGACHRACNNDCFNEYGYTKCALWADMPGSVINGLGTLVDYSAAPSFDSFLYFSDEPTFTPRPVTTKPTPTTKPTTPATTRETTIPTTTLETTTRMTSPAITVSEPTAEGTEPPLSVQRQTCISRGGTWDYSVEACYLPPTTAAPTIGIPDIFQDKPKIQYTADDFKKAAEDAAKNGNNDLAIQYIDAAESKLTEGYSDKGSRPASVDESLAGLEKDRASVYHSWPGHETEEKIANDNAKDLQKTADSKSSSFDLPGFEMWAAVLSVMLLFLFRKIKQ